MRSRIHVVVCIILGSFLVYCTQSTVKLDGRGSGSGGGSGGGAPGRGGQGAAMSSSDGFVGDANAQSGTPCCTPPLPTFTKIAEGDLTSKMGTSAPISLAGYREYAIYVDSPDTCSLVAAFRPDANTPFGIVVGTRTVARGPVQGSDMQLIYASTGLPCNKAHYVVAGVN